MNEFSRPPENPSGGPSEGLIRAAERLRARSARTKWGAAALLLVALASGYWLFGRAGAPAQSGFSGGAPPVTVAVPLARTVIEWDEFAGQFEAVDYVEVRARVNGYLQSVHFQDGQMVKRGELLFAIDPRPYEASLATAEAALHQNQAQLELAARQVERNEALRKKDFVSASAFDQRVEEKKRAEALVEAARAQVRAAKLNLDYTRVAAPLSGRIGRKEMSAGNLVAGDNAGQASLLATIVSLDPVRFVFDMSESEFLAYQRAVAAGKMKSARDITLKVEA